MIFKRDVACGDEASVRLMIASWLSHSSGNRPPLSYTYFIKIAPPSIDIDLHVYGHFRPKQMDGLESLTRECKQQRVPNRRWFIPLFLQSTIGYVYTDNPFSLFIYLNVLSRRKERGGGTNTIVSLSLYQQTSKSGLLVTLCVFRVQSVIITRSAGRSFYSAMWKGVTMWYMRM